MRSKRIWVALALSALWVVPVVAQQVNLPVVGYPGEVASSRLLGMGGAQVAVADDAYAAASNPAGLARLRAYWTSEEEEQTSLLFGSDEVDKDSAEFVATGGVMGGLPRGGIAYAGSGDDDDKGYGVTGDVLVGRGGFPTTLLWSAGYGSQVGQAEETSWGVAVDGVHATGLNVVNGRIGILWISEDPPAAPDEGIAVGVTVGYNNLGAMNARGGAAVHIGDSALVAADVTWIAGRPVLGWNIGAEGEVSDRWVVRVGSNNAYGTAAPSLCVGLGYQADDSEWRTDVGYEYRRGAGMTLLVTAGSQF